MPAKTKSNPLVVTQVLRTRKSIAIAWTQGDGNFDLNERDNPLPSFLKAFDALPPVACRVIGVPESYLENLRVIGMVMGAQGAADTVSFVVRKGLSDAAKEFAFKTPPRLLAHPTEPGSYTPPLSDADAALVHEAFEEAKSYVKGDRAQGQIAFEDEDGDVEVEAEEKDDATEKLPLVVDIVKEGKKARAKKKAATA